MCSPDLVEQAAVGMFDIQTGAAIDAETIEGTSRVVEAPALAQPEAEVGTDTPAEASPVAPEATEAPGQAPSASEPAPVASAPPPTAITGTIKPAITPPSSVAEIIRNSVLLNNIRLALEESGITVERIREFQYEFQLGKDAIIKLAADGYRIEQIVAILKGEAQPDLGWGKVTNG